MEHLFGYHLPCNLIQSKNQLSFPNQSPAIFNSLHPVLNGWDFQKQVLRI